MVLLRQIGAALCLVVGVVAFGLVALFHGGYCPEALPSQLWNGALGVIGVCAVGAGLIGASRAPFGRRLALSLLAAVPLAAWSVLLLSRTLYLEPLPGSAGTMGLSLLVAAALGAGLIAGLQWWTLVLLPAGVIGFSRLSESLYDSGVECWPFHPHVSKALLLLPVAILAGAIVARFAMRAALVAGIALVVAPVVVFGWAGLRHARPIDSRPAEVYPIDLPALPALPTYRGLKIGDSRQRMLSLLGPPDRASRGEHDGTADFIDYTYGADTITFARSVLTGSITRRNIVFGIVVRDPKAATAEGVGIGDNLELFRRRYPGAQCFTPLQSFDPICDTESTYKGVSAYAYVVFENDPIDTIRFEGLP
jgi:hypothetical protein